ncbi:MAG TPA: PilC/PilY family type IV pilus protein [Rhodanobacteraceae bacterium]
MSRSIRKTGLMLALAGLLVAGAANAATTYKDDFTGTSASLNWTALNDACLTAGNGTGSIPACSSVNWMNGQSYTIPAADTTPGQGALLLTPPRDDQTGAILSGFPPFPLSQGIQITFTTYTYGGDSGGLSHDGADGIVFFLTDGTKPAPTKAGAEGGSMGYDCSNDNGVYDGIAYGYLGLGIDEFGNFLNSGDNGSEGIINSNAPGGSTANGTNTYWDNGTGIGPGTGLQYQPQRIGLRGAGNTNWAWLQANGDPTYYSGVSAINAVQAACRMGVYVSSHNTTTSTHHGKTSTITTWNYSPIQYNYNPIPGGYSILPDSEPIANEQAHSLNPTAGQSAPWPITYRLTISAGGLLNFAYSYNNGSFQPVLSNFDITSANGPLPASLRFGFSAGTGGDNNVHEITCFEASPLQAQSSAGANTVTGKVTGNSQFFLASYSMDNWWGSLVADPLIISADGTLSVGTDANWDAKCVLTGGPCDSMGVDSAGNPTTSVPVQAPADRTLLTSDALGADKGVPLQWSDLSATEQTALNAPTANPQDTTPGQNRVAWLTGDRAVEQLAPGCSATSVATPPCDMRARTYVLGDIINSSPTFVGAPTPGAYPDVFYDQLYGGGQNVNPEDATGATSYSSFASTDANRVNVVYVGSNDGFVHGFEAGVNGDGAKGAPDNDGKELVGYMPYDVLMNKVVNLTNPLYRHNYLVDATPVAGDVFYGNTWHTWLVGGVGSAGSEIYALNVTDPSAFAASDVIGDWDSTTLTHLGNTVGTPIIARMHNGDWAFISGSGLVPPPATGAPAAPTEGVYIGLIDPSTGAVTFQFLDTGAEPAGVNGADGGIAYVSSVDLDGDHIADYLYAGDTQGRVWRFDVTSNKASNWKVSTFGNGTPTPLFTATDAGVPQPITTAITALAVQTGTTIRNMVFFGTGQQTPATTTQGIQYTTGEQTFYGIWDWDMAAWNKLSKTDYASLSGTQSFTRANLLAQTTQPPPDSNDPDHRYLSNQTNVCWKGDPTTTQCSSAGQAMDQYGWMFDLPDTGPATGELKGQQEQIIFNPTFIDGAVVVNTAIPPEISAAQCNAGTQSGFTMAFDPANGGGFAQGFFPDKGGGYSGGTATVGGTLLKGVGTPTSVQYGGKSYLVTQTITGAAVLIPTNPPVENRPSRVSWRELVNP